MQDEGELSVDAFRDDEQLVIRAPMAGVTIDDIELSIHGDLLTIRGERKLGTSIQEDDWFYRECYWGAFSRSIVLPVDVNTERAQATLKHGLLEIRFPIRGRASRITITPSDE